LGILVVCTGNTCRSPMAEVLLRHHLAAAGVDLAVESAGTLGWGDRPATDKAVAVMAEHGVDLSGHVSRRMDTAMVNAADLVVAMTRVHAWAVVAREADAAERTFLLDEAVRLGTAVGPRGHEDLAAWVAELDRRRPPDRPLGHAREEVADPAGEDLATYRATAARLDRSIRRLVGLL
jgi:protein-tyrosine phosphatase